jgi:hypothetical protein
VSKGSTVWMETRQTHQTQHLRLAFGSVERGSGDESQRRHSPPRQVREEVRSG